jgi:hypothetical protein
LCWTNSLACGRFLATEASVKVAEKGPKSYFSNMPLGIIFSVINTKLKFIGSCISQLSVSITKYIDE